MPDTTTIKNALASPYNSSVTIDLDALRHNIRQLQTSIGDCKLMGVVKANAYGHGSVIVSRELIKLGVEMLAVATVREGIELRNAGITARILVMAAPLPAQLDHYVAFDLEVTIPSVEMATYAVEFQRQSDSILRAHLKVDTGMGRLGCQPDELILVLNILNQASISVESVWTHLANATDVSGVSSSQQDATFKQVIESLGVAKSEIPLDRHLASSNAVSTYRDSVLPKDYTWARLGIALYGIMDQREYDTRLDLQPVMRWTSRLVQIKEVQPGTPVSYGSQWVASSPTLIGTIRVGYADGYSRSCSGKAFVGIHGKQYPVAGTICMDMMMVDLGDPANRPLFSIGDEVVLMGPGGPSAIEIADWSGTISYEVTTRITARAERKTAG